MILVQFLDEAGAGEQGAGLPTMAEARQDKTTDDLTADAAGFAAGDDRPVRRFARLSELAAGMDRYQRFYYSSRTVIFLIDLLIGIGIGYMLYVLQWSYVREKLILFTIWFLSVFDFLIRTTAFKGTSLGLAIAVDLVFVIGSAAISGCCKEYRNKIRGNLLLLAGALLLSWQLMFRHGIISNSVPILCCILLILFWNQYGLLKADREKARIASERSSAEFAVVRHISHNVRPQVLIARAPLLTVRSLLRQRGLLDEPLPDPLPNGSSETIGEALDKALTSLRQINDIVGNARDLIGREINAADFEPVDLQQVFEQDIIPLYADVDLQLHLDCRVARPVLLHRASLVEALHNLIRNARTHSFPDDYVGQEPKQLWFSIAENVKDLFIDYRNNGLPFPDNLDEKDFLTFGRKSSDSPGEGLGGAWIGRVIEAHGGTFTIIRDGQPVHFHIALPKRKHHGSKR
jgi:signal transduction histidine kinase